MPSLRDFRDRIKSVKSTRKITSAMKMVAASKLRKAQEQAEASQPYAQAMSEVMARVTQNVVLSPASSKLLVGTGSEQRHLLVLVTADRGLCGGFNTNTVKLARKILSDLEDEGKDVALLCAGKKGKDLLKREYKSSMWKDFSGIGSKAKIEYAEVAKVSEYILEKFDADEFDVCTLIYSEFVSVLTQKPTAQQLIPFKLPESANAQSSSGKEKEEAQNKAASEDNTEAGYSSPYNFEPEEEQILQALLPKNIGVQIFRALLDSAAGEQAARMTAMDNATRNAGEMIDDLTLQYNRARQAYITKELIEIISGAEAL